MKEETRMKKLGGFLFSLTACALLALAGCSSSSSSSSAPTVAGIASTGAAISGTVTLKDATGEELGPQDIGADGSFSFDVTGLTPPFVIKAEAGEERWFSYAAGPGTANVNPLTMLALAMAMESGDPEDAYADPSEVTDDAIASALDDVQALFANLFAGFGVGEDFDPFTGDCTVNHRGIDALFDDLDITIDSTGNLKVAPKDSPETPLLPATPLSEIAETSPVEDALWGTYNYCYLFFDTPTGGNESDAGTGSMTFVTDGTYTAVEESPSSGTYSIDAPGEFVFDSNPNEPGFMTPDREIMVMPDMDASGGNDVGISILCKRDTSLTAADISGTYLLMELGRETVSGTAYAASEIAVIAFNGSGGYTAEEGESGTYTVDADTGRITVNTPDGALTGMVAKGGDVIVAPFYDESAAEAQISVLVRTSSKDPWSVSSLNGNYYLSELYSAPVVDKDIPNVYAAYTVSSELSMNNGAVSGHFIDSAGDEYGSNATYVTANSHPDEPGLALDYFLVEGAFLGIASPDGEFFVMTSENFDPIGSEEAGISLGVKTLNTF
jgi:hypothetical protein